MAQVRLDIPARVDYLGIARQVVAAAAALEPRFRDERIDDLRIAVSEATTNAIEAHADLSNDERIVIRLDLADDHIEVEVVDRGGGFEPASAAEAPPAESADRLEWERGLGLPLMRTLTDSTEITTVDGGTSVRLVVFTSASRPEGGSPST